MGISKALLYRRRRIAKQIAAKKAVNSDPIQGTQEVRSESARAAVPVKNRDQIPMVL